MISRQLATITKKTVGSTLRHNGLKSCNAHNVPLFKKAHVQAHLKFEGAGHFQRCP